VPLRRGLRSQSCLRPPRPRRWRLSGISRAYSELLCVKVACRERSALISLSTFCPSLDRKTHLTNGLQW
jgi:hypothetical protein